MEYEEEDYFGDRRKERKQEQRLASAKDRSKYKKTDKAKRAQADANLAPPSTEGMTRSRVISIVPQGYVVQTNDQQLVCTLRGAMKKERTQHKNLVVVGDYVWIEQTSPGEGVINSVEPRATVLSRADNLSRRKEHLIASNIDQVLITMSVVDPALKPALIDRYIIATQMGGMKAIVVINKIDLLGVASPNEISLYEEVKTAYHNAGIELVAVSVVTGEGMDKLHFLMKDRSSVFSGQSGVGKTSLINAVTGLTLRTGETVFRTGKGSHTTTSAQLVQLSFGGWCVDTPGIKSFGVWDLAREDVEAYFPEIHEAGSHCKYADCSHTGEDGCAVEGAVENGEIAAVRFASYLMLMDSISSDHTRR